MTCMPVTFMLRLLHSVVVRSPNLASHKRRENVSVVPPDDDSYSTATVTARYSETLQFGSVQGLFDSVAYIYASIPAALGQDTLAAGVRTSRYMRILIHY